jgi:hypothetical protein
MEGSDPDQEAWLGMTNENPLVGGIDVSRPSVALGGKDNFASDRDMGRRMAELNPHRSAADLASILNGLEPVAPGVSEARRWMAGTGGEPADTPVYPLVAVGIKSG